MKRLMMTTALIAMGATGAIAQTTTAADADARFRTQSAPTEIHASSFIGKRVYTAEAEPTEDGYVGVQDGWEDVGEINDVVLNRDGQVEAILVDIGGFLGIGERQIAVNMNAIKFVADDETPEDLSDYFLVMSAAKADFEAAPEYEWSRESRVDGAEEQAMAESSVEQNADVDAVKPVANTETAATGTVATDPAMKDTTADNEIDKSEFDTITVADIAADKLEGAPVYDGKDNWIGEVSELILNADMKVEKAIVDVGGFLGIGEKPVALTADQLDVLKARDGDAVRVHVAMTKEELEAMATYEK